MREIKFRAWNGEKFQYFGIGTFWHNTDISVYHGLVLDGVKFEQFTGLHDKTGKEIYEGDIIQGNLFDCRLPTMGTIIYDEFLSGYANKNDGGHTLLFNINNKEIIGNIHENPELIEAK